jgi:hypothetical protein
MAVVIDNTLLAFVYLYHKGMSHLKSTVEPAYGDIALYDSSPTASDFLRYELIRHC